MCDQNQESRPAGGEYRPVGPAITGDIGKAFQPWAADALRTARANRLEQAGEQAAEKPQTANYQASAGRPTLINHITARRRNVEAAFQNASLEIQALDTAHAVLERNPEFGALIDALITLRILK
jgi:hypothetical protein